MRSQPHTSVDDRADDLLSSLMDPEPWPSLVDGAALLDELRRLLNRFLILPPGVDYLLSCWAAHTWFSSALRVTPYLLVTSPRYGCGKSTFLMRACYR